MTKPTDQEIYAAWDILMAGVREAAARVPFDALHWLYEHADFNPPMQGELFTVLAQRRRKAKRVAS